MFAGKACGKRNELGQICAVIIFCSDSITLLNALACLSFIDNLGAFCFRDIDFTSLFDVVELHVAAPFCVGFWILTVSCAIKNYHTRKQMQIKYQKIRVFFEFILNLTPFFPEKRFFSEEKKSQ